MAVASGPIAPEVSMARDTNECTVADYCHSCPEYQKAAGKAGQRAPMIPLPIMGQPFERIAMDIVGPYREVSRVTSILVVCDYATRYPKAILLKKFTADAVAEELI